MRFNYLAMLVFTFIGSGWLELAFGTRVFSRWRRLMATLLPVFVLFVMWDRYAIEQGHWWFDQAQILGIKGPFGIPLEEYAFFLVVPTAAILTMEAVRRVKKQWKFGDE